MSCPFVGIATRTTVESVQVSIRICGAVPYERDNDPDDLPAPTVCFSEREFEGCYHYQTMMKRRAFSRPPLTDGEGNIRFAWLPQEMADFETEDDTRAAHTSEAQELGAEPTPSKELVLEHLLSYPILQATTSTSSSAGGINWLQIIAVVLAFFGAYLVAFWLSLLVWTFKDITARSHDPISVVMAMLLAIPPFIGWPLYMILRPKETLAESYERSLEEEYLMQDIQEAEVCPTCRYRVQEDWMYCANCRTRLRRDCENCHHPINLRWQACPHCGRAVTDVMHTSRLERQKDVRARATTGLQPIPTGRLGGPPTRRVNGTNGTNGTNATSALNGNGSIADTTVDAEERR